MSQGMKKFFFSRFIFFPLFRYPVPTKHIDAALSQILPIFIPPPLFFFCDFTSALFTEMIEKSAREGLHLSFGVMGTLMQQKKYKKTTTLPNYTFHPWFRDYYDFGQIQITADRIL